MFSLPDETMLRSERKMKVVHVQNDKNKAIILRSIVFQPSKFSSILRRSVEAEQYVKNIYFREANTLNKQTTRLP